LLSRVNENPINNFNEDYNGAIPFRSIPIMPIYDETNPYGAGEERRFISRVPTQLLLNTSNTKERNYNRLDGTMYISLTPIKNITIRGQVGYNYLSYLGRSFAEAFDYGAFANPINSLTYASSDEETITANLVVTYAKQFGDHAFKIMGGTESSQFDTYHFNATATDFPVELASSFNLATGTFNVTDPLRSLSKTINYLNSAD
jgi:hypothetical protein